MEEKYSQQESNRKGNRKSLPRIFGKELLIFAFFLLVSYSFWLLRTLNEYVETEVTVPVKLVGVPPEVRLTSELPQEIKVIIRDKGLSILRLLIWQQLHPIEVNYSSCDNNDKLGRGEVSLSYLQSKANELPSSTKIVSVNPSPLCYYYNKGQCRKVPVVFLGKVSAADHYCLNSHSVGADSVLVYAPTSVLDTLKRVYTKYTRLDNLTSSSSVSVPIDCQSGMICTPSSIKVSYSVDPLVQQTTEVPVGMKGFPSGRQLTASPNSVQVTYWVKASDANGIVPDDFRLEVDYKELEDQDDSLRCHPILKKVPRGLHYVDISPKEVSFVTEGKKAS